MTTILIVIAVIAYLAVGIFLDLATGLPGRGLLDRGLMTLLWPIWLVAFVLPALFGLLSYEIEQLVRRLRR